MDVTFRIPTKPHIRKYLKVLYGQNFRLGKTTSFGIMMLEILNKQIEKPSKSIAEFHSFYTIIVPEMYFNVSGFNIGRNKRKFLAIWFDKRFNEDLFRFVDLEVARNGNAMGAIRDFLRIHTITENELNLESVYKSYQRYCNNKIKSKKKLERLCA